MLDGDVQGADAIRAVIGSVRELYDRQDFNFAGPWGDNGFIEDYTAEVRGKPLGCLPPGHLQRRRAAPAHRSQLPAAELADVLLPPAARKVRRHRHTPSTSWRR